MVLSITMSLLLAIVSVIVGVYIYAKYFLYTYWERKGVFYLEPTFPFGNIGNILMGKMSQGNHYAQQYAEHKEKRFYGTFANFKPVLAICDPDLIRCVLSKDFVHFRDRGIHHNRKIDPLIDNLLHMGGDRWKNMRTKLTPTFTSSKVKQMYSIIQNFASKMADHLEQYADRNEIVEMKELSARATTDAFVSIAFGIESNSIDYPDSEFRYWGRKVLKPNFWKESLLVFFPFLMDLLRVPKNDADAAKFFIKTIRENIEYRIANKITRPDFMDLLIQLIKRGYVDNDDGKISEQSEKKGGTITIEEAIPQAFVFLIAGYETTSSTITFCLYELARSCNESIQDKVRAEIDEILEKNDGQITYESIKQMSYLHKVIYESMRKYPTLPVINRRCTKEYRLPGTNLTLPEGMDIIIPALGLHTDPDIFPNPMKFDPERFNEVNSVSRHPFVYLPFGEGPRYCIGSRFGILESKVVVVNIISRYKLSLGPKTPEPMKFAAGALLTLPSTGVEIRFEHRIPKNRIKS